MSAGAMYGVEYTNYTLSSPLHSTSFARAQDWTETCSYLLG